MTTDIERIREALRFIPVGGHDERVRVAFMLKSELGDSGRDLWDEWRGDRGNDEADAVWRSASETGSLKIGTLFHEAKANGWRDDGEHQKPTAEELAVRRRIAEDLAAKEAAEIASERSDTAARAAAILKAATAAKADNPYMLRKQVSPVETLREIDVAKVASILGYVPKSGGEALAGRLLVVPVKQGDRISTVELIDGDGRKAALAGRGSKAGGYWATERLPGGDGAGVDIKIGEGVATVLTAKAATGHPGVAALSASNLMAVAKEMREQSPAAAITILAELVKATGEPDPHAIEAARAVGGLLAIPEFGPDRPNGATDFNDMAQLCGLDAVREAIARASEPARASTQASDENAPGADVWPAPLPIPDLLLPVEPFAYELLPECIRTWVADVSERMQCPPDFVAVAALVVLSSVIGRKAGIRPKRRDNWTVIPNLWGVVVGRPGVMKSPALSEVTRLLDRLQARASDLYEVERQDYEIGQKLKAMGVDSAEKKAAQAVKDGKTEEARRILSEASGADALPLPLQRRYCVTDTTVEKLGEILVDNPAGTLAYRDELHGLLCSMDRPGQEGARAFYLQGYDGNQGYTFDRVVRGHKGIPAVCISMLGGIQPGKLQAYIRDATSGGAGDDGLLQRFGLLVWPDIPNQWKNVDRVPDKDARQAVEAVMDRLDGMEMDIDPVTGDRSPRVFRFTPEAQEVFDEWRHDFETDLRRSDRPPAVESHLSKYRKLVPAVALVCAIADGEHEVSAASLARALAWAEYLQSHAERAYAAGSRPATDGAKSLLAKIKAGALADGFSVRDVYLKGWANLGNTEAATAAATMLCDLGYLRHVELPTGAKGGRPTAAYLINPKLSGAE